jgi:DNA-binding transcriptional MerR regulator
MGKARTYQVKEVAELTGVSVRALHHYDERGLLVPSRRSAAGYRLYTDADLLRLQQVLIARELGLSLDEIKRSLDDPTYDRRAALSLQRAELAARIERTSALLRAVDAALSALDEEGDPTMEKMGREELAQLFEGFDPARHEEEAKERWGDTAAYAESARRTRDYGKADWERYKAESHVIMLAAAELFGAGADVEGEEARSVAERHRHLIDRWFYPCDRAMHARLAEMYEADLRFSENIDKYGEGLTPWLSGAIRANARRE